MKAAPSRRAINTGLFTRSPRRRGRASRAGSSSSPVGDRPPPKDLRGEYYDAIGARWRRRKILRLQRRKADHAWHDTRHVDEINAVYAEGETNCYPCVDRIGLPLRESPHAPPHDGGPIPCGEFRSPWYRSGTALGEPGSQTSGRDHSIQSYTTRGRDPTSKWLHQLASTRPLI